MKQSAHQHSSSDRLFITDFKEDHDAVNKLFQTQTLSHHVSNSMAQESCVFQHFFLMTKLKYSRHL